MRAGVLSRAAPVGCGHALHMNSLRPWRLPHTLLRLLLPLRRQGCDWAGADGVGQDGRFCAAHPAGEPSGGGGGSSWFPALHAALVAVAAAAVALLHIRLFLTSAASATTINQRCPLLPPPPTHLPTHPPIRRCWTSRRRCLRWCCRPRASWPSRLRSSLRRWGRASASSAPCWWAAST